jgi:hypothetical protein
MKMIDRADQGGRREHANAGNRLKSRGHWMRGGDLRELPIEGDDPGLERSDFVDHERQGVAEHLGQFRFCIRKNGTHALEHSPSADRYRLAVFTQQSTHRVDSRDARRLPLRAYPMQRLQRLLFDRLHRHRTNLTAAGGFQQGFDVRAIRLVAAHVRSDILRRQQPHTEIVGLTPPAPIMGRAARLHDHVRASRQCFEESLELTTRQPLPFDHAARAVRTPHLENVFCEIHRHRRSIHVGLLLVSWGHPRSSRQILPRNNREESMPSVLRKRG